MAININLPVFLQNEDWDCGLAVANMYNGSPIEVKRTFWWVHGVLPPDLWRHFATYHAKLPERIPPGEIRHSMRFGEPVLNLCCNLHHWQWIDGQDGHFLHFVCPTDGAEWKRRCELDGVVYRMSDFPWSAEAAFMEGIKETAKLGPCFTRLRLRELLQRRG